MALFRENAVVVITGADGGIGKVLVAHLTKLGATVVRCDRGEPDPHNFDVRDRAGWDRMLDAVIEEHGRIDALINNAGRQAQGVDTVVDLDDDEWQAVMDVNVKGVRLGMSTTIPRFGPDGGRIINTASVAGHLASPGSSVYCTSKAAVLHMTRQAAVDYAGSGVLINAIAPGMMENTMHDGKASKQRDAVIAASLTGQPVRDSEIALCAEFLLDGRITSMVGSMLAIDAGPGGMLHA